MIVACVPLVLAQRVVPFSRVYLFAFPLVAGMAWAGLVHLTERLPAGRRAWTGPVAVAVALALTAAHAIEVQERMDRYPYSLARFRDAEAVVKVLKGRLQRGDRIVVVGESLVPFQYYCTLHRLPYETYVYDYLRWGWDRLRQSARVFVVVNEQAQTLEMVIERARLTDAAAPVPIVKGPASGVYLVGGLRS